MRMKLFRNFHLIARYLSSNAAASTDTKHFLGKRHSDIATNSHWIVMRCQQQSQKRNRGSLAICSRYRTNGGLGQFIGQLYFREYTDFTGISCLNEWDSLWNGW